MKKLVNSDKPFSGNNKNRRPTSCFETPARISPTAIPLSVIDNLPILCFYDEHVSELYIYSSYFFVSAPARFARALLLISYRPQ